MLIPGTRAFELYLLANVKLNKADADSKSWPIGTLALLHEVNQTGMQRVESFLQAIGAVGQSVVVLAGALMTLAGAWPVVRRFVPLRGAHQSPDAKPAI